MYYIYLGEGSSSAMYVFVSNTLSSLYLNSCHAYLQDLDHMLVKELLQIAESEAQQNRVA